MPGEIRRIAEFLDISIDESRRKASVEHCSFAWMKQHASKSMPLGGAFWDAGAAVLINTGVNGRWANILMPREIAEYESRAAEKLDSECARALATGEELKQHT